MKDKIFTKLKTAYSALGLGDAVLLAHAEVLSAMGFVTDENLEQVITAQRPLLESMQKANDTRATTAQKTAEDKAKAEIEKLKAQITTGATTATEAQKKIKELEEKIASMQTPPAPEPKKPTEEEVMPAWYKAELKKQEEGRKKAEEAHAKLMESIKALETKNAQYEAEKAALQRKNFISTKAKQLGVPDWRINEGFAFANDATDDAIVAHLTAVVIYRNRSHKSHVFLTPQGKKCKKTLHFATYICSFSDSIDSYILKIKRSNNLYFRLLLQCRGDWIRTSDPTPPRRIL